MEELSDNQLMTKVKSGDVGQLGLIFERYKRSLYQYFYHVSRDAIYAEDAVQTVFERILRYRHRFRGDGDFKAWIFHIARNVFYDHVSRKKRHFDSLEQWRDRLPDSDDPQQNLTKKEDLKLLDKAMDLLPPDKREILVMSKLNGMRYKVIADCLKCSEGAVKVKVFRALNDLRKIYFEIEKNKSYGFAGSS